MTLWSILALLFIAACFLRNAGMAWGAFVLIADWVVCTLVAHVAHDQFIWPVLAAVDYTAALLLIAIKQNRWGAVLAATYVIEGMAHVAFGLSAHGDFQKYEYWWTLHDVAWGQAWTVLIWGIWTGGKKLRRYHHNRRRTASCEVGALCHHNGGTA